MNHSQRHPSSPSIHAQRIEEQQTQLSELLRNALLPLFNDGTSRQSIPALMGTAFCIESDGYRFLVTAKHVIDDLKNGIWVRNSLDQVVHLTDFQQVDIPDSDIALLEIGFSQPCKHLQPIFVESGTPITSGSAERIYIEGFPATKKKSLTLKA